jgi:hypothetical protein
MPLIVVCGRPCSGKSAFARALADALAARGLPAALLAAEEAGGGAAFGGDRAHAFADAAAEKTTRAWLRSAVERALTGAAAVVVADGGAGVKGFRYELHCAARNVGARVAVVWVGPDVTRAAARAVNAARRAAQSATGATAYEDATLDALWARFEPPDARNRWDSPLVRVSLAAPSARAGDSVLARAAARGQLPSEAAAAAAASSANALGGAFTAESFWERAAASAARASGDELASPFLTSRFALRGVFSAAALAAERGVGATVEATVGATRRAARQNADARAGYGDVPLTGFTRALRAAPQGAAPDYFAADFNADEGSDDDGADIADMRDFDGVGDDAGDTPALDDALLPEPAAASSGFKSSFRRPERAAALVAIGTVRGDVVTLPAALSEGDAAAVASTACAPAQPADSIRDAIEWLVAFAQGRVEEHKDPSAHGLEGAGVNKVAGSVASAGASSARPVDDNMLLAAATASSATVLEALADTDVGSASVIPLPPAAGGGVLRLPRATSLHELARLRRTYLSGDVGAGTAVAFLAFVRTALRAS